MFSELFNLRGINWWTLLGGIGMNFIITIFLALSGAYLGLVEETAEAYAEFGLPAIVLALFLACGLAGFIVARIADDVPVKHSFVASLGAVTPLAAVGILSFNPLPIMMALVAVAGNLNGGMLAMRRSRSGGMGSSGRAS
jgi:hypothetical protein